MKKAISMNTKCAVLIFSMIAASVFAAGPEPPAGCISWWPGDGNANDILGPNNGTLQGGVTFTAGRFGQAFQFDGIDDIVLAETNNLPTGNDDRTLEMWAKIDVMRNDHATFAGYGNTAGITEFYEVGGRFQEKFLYFASGGQGNSSGSERLSLNVWYHVAVTNVGNAIKVYLNGTLVEEPPIPIHTVANQFYIGSKPGGVGSLDGAVDEVRIYNRALSASEIQAIANGQSGGQSLSFSDVSQSSGIANQNVGTAGVQWVDFNNDGLLDLFFAGSNGCALFKNSKSGKFTDVTSQVAVGNQGKSARGASWADIDNDGRADVFISNTIGAPTLLLNKKAGFRDISGSLQSSGGSSRAGIWVDINQDRLIDLYVINEGAPNQLFKQTSGTRFSDIAGKAGVGFKGPGRSAVSADFNGDGFLDIYLTNFKQPNKLYISNGNDTFREVGKQAGVALSAGSVQAVVADFNGDQKIDILVVNSSGSSVLYQNKGNLKFSKKIPASFKKAKAGISAAAGDFDLDGDEDLVVQTGKGSPLLLNDGNGNFEQAKGVNLNASNNTSGVAVGDFNKDGDPDVVIGEALFKNDSALANHFLEVKLNGNQSNRSGIGATVLIQAGSTFQIKVVTAGNGNSQSGLLHFGVGSLSEIDSLRVLWPSGVNQNFQNLRTNKILKITEK